MAAAIAQCSQGDEPIKPRLACSPPHLDSLASPIQRFRQPTSGIPSLSDSLYFWALLRKVRPVRLSQIFLNLKALVTLTGRGERADVSYTRHLLQPPRFSDPANLPHQGLAHAISYNPGIYLFLISLRAPVLGIPLHNVANSRRPQEPGKQGVRCWRLAYGNQLL